MFTINTAPQDVYIEDLIDKKAPLSYHQCHKRCFVAHLNLINQLSWKAFFGDQNQSQNYRCNQFYHLSTVMVCTVGDTRNCLCWLIRLHGQLISCHDQFSKGSRKKRVFYGKADCKGGWGHHICMRSSLELKCNFAPFQEMRHRGIFEPQAGRCHISHLKMTLDHPG